MLKWKYVFLSCSAHASLNGVSNRILVFCRGSKINKSISIFDTSGVWAVSTYSAIREVCFHFDLIRYLFSRLWGDEIILVQWKRIKNTEISFHWVSNTIVAVDATLLISRHLCTLLSKNIAHCGRITLHSAVCEYLLATKYSRSWHFSLFDIRIASSRCEAMAKEMLNTAIMFTSLENEQS